MKGKIPAELNDFKNFSQDSISMSYGISMIH